MKRAKLEVRYSVAIDALVGLSHKIHSTVFLPCLASVDGAILMSKGGAYKRVNLEAK